MANLSDYLTAAGAGGGMTALYKSGNYTLVADDLVYSEAGLIHTLPITPNTGDKCSVWDTSDSAGTNAITVLRNGETIMGAADDFSLNMNGGRVDFLYTGTTWVYSYVVQTIQPSTTITHTETEYYYPEAGLNRGTTNPCSAATVKTFSVGNWEPVVYPFTGAWAQCFGTLLPPEKWNTGTLRYRYIWSPSSTNTGLVSTSLRISPTDDSGVITVNDVLAVLQDTPKGVADKIQISSWSTPITPTVFGAGDVGGFRFLLDGSHAFTGTFNLVAIQIEWTWEETLTAAVSNNPNTVSRDITGISDTIVAADAGKVLYCSNAAAQDLGIPDGLPVGFQFIIAWEGVGQPSVSMDGTDTIVGDLTPAAQYKRLHVEKRNATTWWGTA